MKLIGVTGTDGKTTTSMILKQLLGTKYNVGYIGTNGIHYNDIIISTINTTPSNDIIVDALEKMSTYGVDICVIEVSSHGIKQNRVKGLEFDVAIFTNISHEHLDYHLDMDDYFNTKKELFKNTNLNVINNDDPYSEYIKDLKPNYVTYSLNEESQYYSENIRLSINKTLSDITISDRTYSNVVTNLFGRYNQYNLLAAIAVCKYYGIEFVDLITTISNIERISGRFESINHNDFNVVIDFAHTPNGLKNLLHSVKESTDNNVILVCGSAGEKDGTKRPIMGEIVLSLSDHVIFTAEDPRSENPENIIKEMIHNHSHDNYEIVIDRREAIRKAIKIAKDGDTVLITGKGNENTQELENIVIPHNDIFEAKMALELR